MAREPTITISDVAEQAGVSVGTVSTVVNRPERVADETRLRVREAIKALGWVPNGSAATLRAGRATLVGLILPDIRNPFFTDVARGADERYLEWLSGRGIALVLLDHRRSAGHVPSVVVDDVLGGRLAAEHLLRLGHRRIAFLNGPISIPQCEDRRPGLLQALAGGGLDPDRDLTEVTVESRDGASGLPAV